MATKASTTRVGLLILLATVALASGIFLIGDQNRLFASKNRYTMTVPSAQGLNEGNPVHLNGVTVGLVEKILLPRGADEQELTVEISIERRYAARIRTDSESRIRTLGLLGDKFVEVTSGSLDAEEIPPGGEIPVAAATDVDRLIASGEDVVDNVAAISHSLRNVLERVDRGEGVVGELTTQQEGRRLTDAIFETLDSVRAITESLESGQGPVGRLIQDEAMGRKLASSIERLDGVLNKIEEGDGLLATLLDDEALPAELNSTLAELRETSQNVRAFTAKVEGSAGLMDKLLTDEAWAVEVAADIETLVDNLAQAAEKLNQGEGSAAQVLNDPQVYDAVNDILVGIDESRILRWLIRNRQKKGTEVRYEEAVAAGAIEPMP